MSQLAKNWSLAVFGLAALFVAGCGGEVVKHPPLGKVKGTVTYKGTPVSGAVVSFMMERAPRGATGTTDANGNYKLTTFDTNDGAFVGTHKVTVVKFVPADAAQASKTTTPEDLAKVTAEGKLDEFVKKKKSEIPEKYTDFKTTPLQFTIEPGQNEKKIELED
ncbi:MAG: carboxypeptidase-like regulatory domain-containing protein [Planctomycetales bacterium]|nr:carboxypeptidase-like regulatory domain-containing protein [Planctomycetales bacterium]